jgi:hypothetical protein
MAKAAAYKNQEKRIQVMLKVYMRCNKLESSLLETILNEASLVHMLNDV